MKRNLSVLARAPSPTNTTYSGISNYRTDSYKPLREKGRTLSTPQMDSKMVAKSHFDEMSAFLKNHLAKEPANARQSAREKLTRLTRQQFQELSTDVYDELIRRNNNSENEAVPFLPVRDDFHPKRNQARQKLATLPQTRFKDLSSDVFYELGRRYPEFKEPETPFDLTSPGSSYDDFDVPSPDFPQSPPLQSKVSLSLRSAPATDSGYAGSSSGRRPSEETYRRRPSEDTFVDRNDDGMGSVRRPSDEGFTRDGYAASTTSSRRKPSQDIVANLRGEERRRLSPDLGSSGRRPFDDLDRDRDLGRKPSGSASTTSDSAVSAANTQREMIIPNKSTIAEEVIEVPYGRERESSSTAVDERRSRSPDIRARSPDFRGTTEGEAMMISEPDSVRLPQTQADVVSGFSGRLKGRLVDEDDEDEGVLSGATRSGEEYYDQMSFGRVSVASDRSVGTGSTPRTMNAGAGGRGSKSGFLAEDVEGLRREYEFKIATMQNRIAGLERDLEDAGERERRLREVAGEEKVKTLESELKLLRERTEEQSITMRSLKHELDVLREDQARDKEREIRRARGDAEELDILRERCENLEADRLDRAAGADPETVAQLRYDLEALISELADLSHQNEELMTAKDADLAIIQNLDVQLKEYKRKYEMAKTELRSVKVTSQLFLQAPTLDSDRLPMSFEGGLLDIHVTAFLTATDSLLTAGRSNSPTRVLTPMKAIVNSVSAILEDVRNYEQRSRRDRTEIDSNVLQTLCDRTEATLSNLVTASKTHATGSGLSPVSLLDAAASHLSASITEIGKTILVRKASKAEQDQFLTSPTTPPITNGFNPTLQSVDEMKFSAAHQRAASSSSSRRGDEYILQAKNTEPDMSPMRTISGRSSSGESSRRPLSASSSNASSPPPIFDRHRSDDGGGVGSDDSAMAEGPDEAWAELKPYLEAQSESIVYAIQSVLSGVRSPTPPPTLNENLTQIITIVSSIVAVCKDSIPPVSALQGQDILNELSDHANRLSEVQSQQEVTKESRQVMAKSSFAVANAMKGLMKL